MNEDTLRDRIPAGLDFLETIAEGTVFYFNKLPIPAGFFSERSQAFDKPVRFRGRPLHSARFKGIGVSHADTIVERKTSVDARRGIPVSTRIELVELALESADPIEVHVGSRTELWDVQVDLSSKRPSEGHMSIRKMSDEGGLFDSEFTVFPVFRFIRRCDGTERVLDVGEFPMSSDFDNMLTLRSRQTPWRHEALHALRLQGLNDRFVAGAPTAINEESDSCAHQAEEARDCTVTILAQSRCLCLGGTRPFTARGSPDGGTYTWRIVQGTNRASIVSGANRQTCEVTGNNASAAANDIRLQVTYQARGATCVASIGLTTISAVLSFSSSGTLHQHNDTRQLAPPSNGWPRLGAVTPGNPTNCTGFRKNIEIKATITPNDVSLNNLCQFNFRRTRQSIAGDISPVGTFIPNPFHCPVGGCDDDLTNDDEDLSMSTAGTIFVIDSPGISVGATTTSCTTARENWKAVLCANFTEKLEVDGQQCGPKLLWHAETRIECSNGNWIEFAGTVGQDHRVCVVGAAPVTPDLSLPAAVELLASDSVDDRVRGYGHIVSLHESGQLNKAERQDLGRHLLALARERPLAHEFGSPLALAIRLLGQLQEVEAMPLFMDHLLDDLRFPVLGRHGTLAGAAISSLGPAAVPGIIASAGSADDDEWQLLQRTLQAIEDQSLVRRAICTALDSNPGPLADERLDDYLNARIIS